MYSFFDEQEGDFQLVIRSIAAVKEEAEARYRHDPKGRISIEGGDEKGHSVGSTRQGWLGWIFNVCVKL
jgi:hypothetical protein